MGQTERRTGCNTLSPRCVLWPLCGAVKIRARCWCFALYEYSGMHVCYFGDIWTLIVQIWKNTLIAKKIAVALQSGTNEAHVRFAAEVRWTFKKTPIKNCINYYLYVMPSYRLKNVAPFHFELFAKMFQKTDKYRKMLCVSACEKYLTLCMTISMLVWYSLFTKIVAKRFLYFHFQWPWLLSYWFQNYFTIIVYRSKSLNCLNVLY